MQINNEIILEEFNDAIDIGDTIIKIDKKYFRPVFKAWSGQSLGTFFLVMNASMPESNPGSLHIEEYTDILAYMLSLSRYSAGENKLSSSTEYLNSITIEDRKRTKP